MVYRLDAGTVIDAEGNLVIENLYTGSILNKTQAQGTVSGYASGGTPPNNTSNIIEKYPFSTDANATDVGDLTQGRTNSSGSSSSASGYAAGGNVNPPYIPGVNTIDKFPFSVDGNATDVGDMSVGRYGATGQSSTTHGYSSGGYGGTPHAIRDIIDKHSFSSDGNATDVGNLTEIIHSATSQSSSTNGYRSGGSKSPQPTNTIDKFPFAVDGNATDVGDLLEINSSAGGNNSVDHGYVAGGARPASPSDPGTRNVIQKFPFSSDANSTDVGDLTALKKLNRSGTSSITSGYQTGGTPPPGGTNVIDKFPFAADANATDVGDMTTSRTVASGQQV